MAGPEICEEAEKSSEYGPKRALFKMGMPVTMTQTIDQDTAELLVTEFGHNIVRVSDSDIEAHDSGDVVEVGAVRCTLIHTPGHTPGSQCFLVENNLVAGDTLFLDGCGRTDLPGGDPRQLYLSLTQKLAHIPDDALLYPGHLYSQAGSAPLGDTRRDNVVFRPKTEDEWLRAFG